MKGKYHICVQNSRIRYEFDIKRNITIIRGDSASGKTTLFSMIESYNRLGEDSGIEIVCKKECITVNNATWDLILDKHNDSIVFIDEDSPVIKSQEFAEKIKNSGNYYVIITREDLPNLPYSVDEIYGIHNSGKYADTKRIYNEFYKLYSVSDDYDKKADIVIVEDSNAGYEFFKNICSSKVSVISAGGKTKIRELVSKYTDKEILVVADGAAFGSEINEMYLDMQKNQRTKMYLPESFEWIILRSGLIDGNRIATILDNPEDFIESSEYFSWEVYFNKLLVKETEGTYLQYSKSKLNSSYLNDKEKNRILNVIKIIIGIICD